MSDTSVVSVIMPRIVTRITTNFVTSVTTSYEQLLATPQQNPPGPSSRALGGPYSTLSSSRDPQFVGGPR